MSFIEAILFGIFQGFTEIFPISSSGHLAILGNLFGISSDMYNFQMLTVFLHFGTLLSILFVYYPEFYEMVSEIITVSRASRGEVRGKTRYPSVRLLIMMIITCIPSVFLFPLMKYIDNLYYSSYFIGIMLIFSGIILFISDKLDDGGKDERNMTFFDALIIGFCQLVASIPGISRIGLDMTAGKAVGLSKEFSLKYAYLLSVPAVFGMNIVHLVEAASLGFLWKDVPLYLVGMVVSMLTGTLAMRIVRSAAEKGYFHDFAYYCWIAGVLFVILTMIF